MNKLKTFSIISIVFILCLSLVLSSCTGAEPLKKLVNILKDWAPPAPVAGDSVILTPGGPSYVGNTSSNNTNNYPSVTVTQATLILEASTQLHVGYRDTIESAQGETRYIIISLFVTGKDINNHIPQNIITAVNVYTVSAPEGMVVSEGTQWTGGLSSGSVLLLDVSKDVSPGKHVFNIGFLINGLDFGTVPCTLTVTK